MHPIAIPSKIKQYDLAASALSQLESFMGPEALQAVYQLQTMLLYLWRAAHAGMAEHG